MANPDIQRRMHRIVRRSGIRPERALEVGGYVDGKSLLRSKEIRRAERWCINLVDQPDGTGIKHVVGSSNDMHMFKDGTFDLVMSCAVHEHDKKFWLSVAEMHRVLRPGGKLVLVNVGQNLPAFNAMHRLAGTLVPAFWGRMLGSSFEEMLSGYGFCIDHDRIVQQGFYPSRVMIARK